MLLSEPLQRGGANALPLCLGDNAQAADVVRPFILLLRGQHAHGRAVPADDQLGKTADGALHLFHCAAIGRALAIALVICPEGRVV